LVVEVCESGDYQRLEKMFTEIHEDHGVYEAVFVASAVGVIQVASIPPAVGIDVRALPEYNMNIESAIQEKSGLAMLLLLRQRPSGIVDYRSGYQGGQGDWHCRDALGAERFFRAKCVRHYARRDRKRSDYR
jgi:hypothetical protein